MSILKYPHTETTNYIYKTHVIVIISSLMVVVCYDVIVKLSSLPTPPLGSKNQSRESKAAQWGCGGICLHV